MGDATDAAAITQDSGAGDAAAKADASSPTDAAQVDAASTTADGGVCGPYCHVMFVTSTTYTGNLGGQAGADKKCQDRAAMSGVPAISSRVGRFVAWISTGNPGDPGMTGRLPMAGSYARVDGKVIAGSRAELLSGMVQININVDESGSAVVTGNQQGAAWTGTATSGTTSLHTCLDWTSMNDQGEIGRSSDATSTWTDAGSTSCSQSRHLYCLDLF